MMKRAISTAAMAVLTLSLMVPLLAKEKLTPPVLVEKVNPTYPPEAKTEKIQGSVKVEAVIDAQGKVVEATASESPDARLSQAAVDAVKQWKFKPALKDGKAVKAKSTVTINFRLQ